MVVVLAVRPMHMWFLRAMMLVVVIVSTAGAVHMRRRVPQAVIQRVMLVVAGAIVRVVVVMGMRVGVRVTVTACLVMLMGMGVHAQAGQLGSCKLLLLLWRQGEQQLQPEGVHAIHVVPAQAHRPVGGQHGDHAVLCHFVLAGGQLAFARDMCFSCQSCCTGRCAQ